MSDPRSHQTDEPTQEELQAYLEQLRGADPAEVVAQAYTVLATGAEVKLGRHDARVLIDAMNGVAEAAAGRLDEDLVSKMRNGVAQLQMAQVQAEREAAGDTGEGRQAQAPPKSAPSAGAERAGSEQGGSRQEKSVTDRLWIPGREPG